MKCIIALSGLARAGKDTTADILTELLGGRCCKVPMARELKHLAREYFGWDGTKGEEGREILQKLGTDIIREKLNKPLFHAQRVAEAIEIIQDEYDFIFVPDIRFVNEINYLKAVFPNQVIHINVIRENNTDDNLTVVQHQHKSETGMNGYNGYDYVIENNGGLQELRYKIILTMGDFILENRILSEVPIFTPVKIERILDENSAGHLRQYIGETGLIIHKNRFDDGTVKYKVQFDVDSGESAYFLRNEIEVAK